MEHYFGAHTIDNGGIHMAVRRAGNANMRAMQLFTTIPKYYGDKASIRPERVARFREALADDEDRPRAHRRARRLRAQRRDAGRGEVDARP